MRVLTEVTNIVVAGLGGQGVLKASDIIAGVAFLAGLDVKKSEVHGMSQRGGSVASDVRFGARVFSPMVSAGEADFLVVLDPTQIEVNRAMLAPHGVLIEPGILAGRTLRSSKSLNVALLGALSRSLDFPEDLWTQALRNNLAPETARHQPASVRDRKRSRLVQRGAGSPACCVESHRHFLTRATPCRSPERRHEWRPCKARLPAASPTPPPSAILPSGPSTPARARCPDADGISCGPLPASRRECRSCPGRIGQPRNRRRNSDSRATSD